MFRRLLMSNYKKHVDSKRESEKLAKENEADFLIRNEKRYADEYALAQLQIEKEKDPIKRKKMESRLSSGIVDFSDL